jgi:molecular chaperone GrpE
MAAKPSKKLDTAGLKQQLEELTQALQRERADAINLRRRHQEELANLRDHLKANVVRDLLPVIDNFERALGHIPADIKDNDFIKGVQAIVKQFEKTLADLGVERLKTVGEEFNPRYHEAVSLEEGEGTKEIVSEELQAGYKLGDDVIRPAIVRIRME